MLGSGFGAVPAELGGVEDAVRVAERAAVEGVPGETEVRGAEPNGTTSWTSPVVQRTVLGPLAGWGVVVGAAEHGLLPAPSIASRVGGEASVVGAGFELGSVGRVGGQVFEEGPPGEESIGVEVEGDPEFKVEGWAISESGDVLQCCSYLS